MANPENGTTYYIRVRGRVLGPYDVAQLKTLRGRGQFGRANEVSTDSRTWQSAATVEHLFGGATNTKARSASPEETENGKPAESNPPARSMKPVWHYSVGSEQCGPVTLLELRSMVASSQLTLDDFVWKDGMPEWLPIRDVAELQALSKSKSGSSGGAIPVQTFCYACGSPSDPRAEVCPKCGVRQQHQNEPFAAKAVVSGTPIYAGFWKRLAAFMVDSLLLLSAYWTLHVVLLFVLLEGIKDDREEVLAAKWLIILIYQIVGSALLWWLYHSLMESSSLQGTLGKLAVAAKVTDLNGQRITFGRASLRYFGKLLSGAILCVGYVMVAFTQNKQGLHDTMAGCLVVSRY